MASYRSRPQRFTAKEVMEKLNENFSDDDMDIAYNSSEDEYLPPKKKLCSDSDSSSEDVLFQSRSDTAGPLDKMLDEPPLSGNKTTHPSSISTPDAAVDQVNEPRQVVNEDNSDLVQSLSHADTAVLLDVIFNGPHLDGNETAPPSPISTPDAAVDQVNEPLQVVNEDDRSNNINNTADPREVERGRLKTRSRKRQRNEREWVVNKRKNACQAGKAYTNSKGKQILERQIKLVSCAASCKFKCTNKLCQKERQHVFEQFYTLSYEQKQLFLISATRCHEKKRTTTKHLSRRSNSFEYYFSLKNEQIRVCKTFFLSTLNISQKMIYTVHLNKDKLTGIPKKDTRGIKTGERFSEEKSFLRKHIESFPVIESHYCRATTKKTYLESQLNLSKMYSLYRDLCKSMGKKVMRESMYRRIFNSEYNIEFSKPKTDRCDLCEELSVKKKQNTFTDDDEILENIHKEKKAFLREERKKDREIKNEEVAVVTFDLQNVITCPRVEVGGFFYKRKLNVYNLTGHCKVNGTKDVYCVVWNECQAGRGGNEIASSVVKILSDVVEKHPTVKRIITWSDSCVAQNRNSFISTAILLFLAKNENIESVTLKYSIAGHSCCQEVDNIHSQLEKAFSVAEFYSPLSLLRVILATNRKTPFIVIQLQPQHVFEFGTSAKRLQFDKVPFSKVAALCFRKSYVVEYKLNHKDEFTAVNIRDTKKLREKNKIISFEDLLKLKQKAADLKPLPELKKKDITDMLKFMPADDKKYYEGLLKL